MIDRASVDFPQPVSPTSPSVSPRRTTRLTPSTALTLPTWCLKKMPSLMGKCLTRPSARRMTSSSVVGAAFGSGIYRGSVVCSDDSGQLVRSRIAMRLREAPARDIGRDTNPNDLRRQPARGRVLRVVTDHVQRRLLVDAQG